jgi:transmembrane 9 superfamily member 2/4
VRVPVSALETFHGPLETSQLPCRWWWRSYFTSGSSALYLFLYSGFYFYTKLDITKTVAMLMYFGYMLVISYGFFCITGTIGFVACYYFVRAIYSAVKID